MNYIPIFGIKILLAAGLLLYSILAFPCSCAFQSGDIYKQVRESSSSASSVLIAQVESIEISQSDTHLTTEITHFSEIESWKGIHGKQIYTKIVTTCCMCGISFVEGKTYLLYLYGPNKQGYYSSSSCTRTKPAEGAEEEVEVLNSIFPVSG